MQCHGLDSLAVWTKGSFITRINSMSVLDRDVLDVLFSKEGNFLANV